MASNTAIRWMACAAVGLALAGGAQARSDVYWSVGVGAPGAQVILGNAPVYVAPPPVVVHRPPPVYYYPPAPVYYPPPPPVVQVPRPVYFVGGPRWVEPPRYHPHPGYHHGHRAGQWRH